MPVRSLAPWTLVIVGLCAFIAVQLRTRPNSDTTQRKAVLQDDLRKDEVVETAEKATDHRQSLSVEPAVPAAVHSIEHSLTEDCGLALQVRSLARLPIASASVQAFGDNQSLLAESATDAAGMARLELHNGVMSLEVSVAAPGYATEWLALVCPAPGVIPVTLVPSATITGQVFQGGEGIQGASVYAWPESYFQSTIVPNARALRTASGFNGQFTIEGVTPGVLYSVRAGHHGQISKPTVDVQADAVDVRLDLQRVFAAMLRFRDTKGQVPQGQLFAAELHAQPPAPAGAEAVDASILDLAGISLEKMAYVQGYDFVFACVSNGEATELGPIRVSLASLVHLPAEKEIWLHALDSKVLPLYEAILELRGIAGCLRVNIVNSPIDMSATRMVWPQLALWLTGKTSMTVPILEMEGSKLICPIPTGKYSAHFTLTHMRFFNKLADIVVEPDPSLMEATLDLSELGAVHLEVESPSGTPYTGLLTVDVISNGSGEQGTVNFAQAPYLLLLPAGIFDIALGMPRSLSMAGEYEVHGFAVKPSETTIVILQK